MEGLRDKTFEMATQKISWGEEMVLYRYKGISSHVFLISTAVPHTFGGYNIKVH